ncbi:hypothetical protein F5148DRAFT_1201275 [Russula earlei]|uniref:Uncharacterized protein n=1 Tax=Russula earlei TaxID=71964 RepID=A0ACC0U8P5_9AGAM|nr:hypothetical protein F5148DRAFT_1201275 [Russula earlei]
MRHFSHVLAIFCLAVGIAPFFAHASSTPLPDGVPQAHMDQLSSIHKEVLRHGADFASKLKALKTAGHTPESREFNEALGNYMGIIMPLKERVVLLNQRHSTPQGKILRQAVDHALDPSFHREEYLYIQTHHQEKPPAAPARDN